MWPSALPYIATGLRVAVGRAILGVVVAELFTSVSGLGGKMTYYGDYFETSYYFATLFMFIIFSLVMTELVSLLERRYERWRQ
jgi:NitT/TauT family transport system permease protein